MPRIIWSPSSLGDLRRIDTYLSNVDPAAAVRILSAIRTKARQLAKFPESGPGMKVEQRSLGVRGTPYVIVYRFESDRVEVIGVRHTRENWREE